MKSTQQTLILLITDALSRGAYSGSISPAVLHEARLQAVDGLIQPVSFDRLAAYVQYKYAENDMADTLNKHSIPFVILKGFAAAIYYPEPRARAFGDIDFIVPPAFFDFTCETLKSNGYMQGADEGRHIAFSKNGYHFELHRRFSYEDLDIEKYVLAGIDHRVIVSLNNHMFPMLPPLANGLVLLAHIRRHLKSGLGLRQVIDWRMYCDKVVDDEFYFSSLKPAIEPLSMITLTVTVTALCQKYLGLKKSITWCRDADDALVDRLFDNLINTGNFGRKQGEGSKVERITTYIRREGLFHYLQSAGEYNWKAYHKYHFLRPFCWLYQILRYIVIGKGRIGKLQEDIKRGNVRYELLKKLGI